VAHKVTMRTISMNSAQHTPEEPLPVNCGAACLIHRQSFSLPLAHSAIVEEWHRQTQVIGPMQQRFNVVQGDVGRDHDYIATVYALN
jgi:hypothetical protein